MAFHLFPTLCKASLSSVTRRSSSPIEVEMTSYQTKTISKPQRSHSACSNRSSTSTVDLEGRQAVLELRNSRACNYY